MVLDGFKPYDEGIEQNAFVMDRTGKPLLGQVDVALQCPPG